VRFAPAEAVEDWVATASAEARKCRDRGHHRWGDDPYDVEGNRRKGFIRYYKCKCKALLAQYLDADGLVVDSKIQYPDGYLLPKGSGRLSRQDRGLIRLTNIEEQQRRIAMRAVKKQAS
jgi:hypothetical protein